MVRIRTQWDYQRLPSLAEGCPRRNCRSAANRPIRRLCRCQRVGTHGEEGESGLFIVETKKDVETAAHDLEKAVKRNKFGILHVHNLKHTLKEKDLTSRTPAKS